MITKEINKNMLSIDDARIIYRNFSGAAGIYNTEGNRNFNLVIDNQDLASELLNDEWPVKIKPPREEGDDPFITMKIKVNFDPKYPGLHPNIYLYSGNSIPTVLTAETVGLLDSMDIAKCDLDITKYLWHRGNNSGVGASLKAMRVYQNVDRFAAEFKNNVGEAESLDDITFLED